MHRIGNILNYSKKIYEINGKCIGKVQNYRKKSSNLGEQADNRELQHINSVKEVYEKWLQNPVSVGSNWDSFFRSITQYSNQRYSGDFTRKRHYKSAGSSADSGAVRNAISVAEMIRLYQTWGHFWAKLDPLELKVSLEREPYVMPEGESNYRHYKNELKSLADRLKYEIGGDQVFKLPPDTFFGGNETSLTLDEITKRLEETYCGSFGIEYAHITSAAQVAWLRRKFETPGVTKLSNDLRRLTLARLVRAHGFEAFLTKKYPSVKRFSAEGAESIIPCMKQMIDKSTQMGVECFVMGLPHRGRVNIVANVCRQNLDVIFAHFQDLDVKDPDEGDVKYHLGLNLHRLNKVTNKNINVVLLSNPSQLECVGALVQGRARAEQFFRNDPHGKKVMSVQVHGDAAATGQGIVYELVQMTDLPHYTTYGVVHIILNNQLGFTTLPLDGRSSSYASDVGKLVGAPVIHVNGNDPEAVIYAANVAAEWRNTFYRDIFLDIILYRYHGHNEGDEAAFTQPIMYAKIHQIKPTADIYKKKLIEDGVVTAKEVQAVAEKYEKICEQALAEGQKEKIFNPRVWLDSPWKGWHKAQKQELPPTGIPEADLVKIAKIHSSPAPPDFVMHKGYERIFKMRNDMMNAKMMDWSVGEACAFGSMVKEGIPVRCSGQDFVRGPFSHRHYTFHHQKQENVTYVPLNHIEAKQAPFIPINSILSEYAVLGFELGYNQHSPNQFNLWEAQFGDFENTAQCMIDCFICCSEAKWMKQSGLVLSLPHGLEGMGPDHSSARPERFLAQCVDDMDKIPTGPDAPLEQLRHCNWIITHVTTPANLFHALRRQVKMPFRKPLVNFFPKSLLRLPASRSPFAEFTEGTSFQRVIPDPVPPAGVQKVVFSCGKVYYDFLRGRKLKKMENQIALVRIEQVSPFPYDLVAQEAAKYPNAKIVFGQEEHSNQGYHSFVIPRLQKALGGKQIKLVARHIAAAGACGFPRTHARQLNKLFDDLANA